MDNETLLGIAAIVTAFGVPLTAFFSWLAVRKGKKNEKAIGEVHGIVNSQNEALVDKANQQTQRIEALVVALLESGIAVPDSVKYGRHEDPEKNGTG